MASYENSDVTFFARENVMFLMNGGIYYPPLMFYLSLNIDTLPVMQHCLGTPASHTHTAFNMAFNNIWIYHSLSALLSVYEHDTCFKILK